jgi:hypothetical protein
LTPDEYIRRFEEITAELVDLTRRKNANYAHGSDALANLNLIERVTNGKITREMGILVRITDKVSRIGTLLCGAEDQVGESLADSLRDLAAYSIIELISIEETESPKGEPNEQPQPV